MLVHGSVQDHTVSGALVRELRTDLTVYSLDRRGFGASGDGPEYAIERDFEDVAAVVDAVAAREGGPVALWGHSHGANCALGGAAGAIPHARIHVLEGHGHVAHRTDPSLVAAIIRDLLAD